MLLSSLAIGALLSVQQIPEQASVIYSGVPICSSPTSVALVTHDARASVTKDSAVFQSTSYLKNTATGPVSITVSIPVDGHNITWGMAEKMQVSATVDGAAVAITKQDPSIVAPTDAHLRASGVKAAQYHDVYTFKLNFKGREAHSVVVNYTNPLGHAGLDGAQRVVAYSTDGGSSWSAPITQVNLALKYSPRVVFQVFASLPPNSWQVGPNGAFIKLTNVKPDPGSKLIFTFYPGGYDKIGGG